nr:alpha/beta-hydrolase family protein [Mycobacterium sp.]
MIRRWQVNDEVALFVGNNGDTAIVATQYSYLPSWISFLGEHRKSVDAGRLQLPRDHRPKLVLYGESLGAMGGQGAFGYLPDVATMGFSSVLWVGPPTQTTSPASRAKRWHGTRVPFLQHPSDPIVTFWQLSADLANAAGSSDRARQLGSRGTARRLDPRRHRANQGLTGEDRRRRRTRVLTLCEKSASRRRTERPPGQRPPRSAT